MSNKGFNDVCLLEKGASKKDFEEHHVFFQKDAECVMKMIGRITDSD